MIQLTVPDKEISGIGVKCLGLQSQFANLRLHILSIVLYLALNGGNGAVRESVGSDAMASWVVLERACIFSYVF